MNRNRPILLPGSKPDDGPKKPERDIDLDDTLPLAEPKMWTRGFLILCGVVAAIAYMLLGEAAAILEMDLPLLAWIGPLIGLVVIIVIRRLLLPSSARVIRFGPDSVELPKGRNSRRTTTVAYDEIRTIVPLVSRGQPALVVDGPRRTEVYIASDFPHPELWRVLWAQLTDRIRRRPGAAEQLRRMGELSQLSQETSSIQSRFTKRLFWVIAAIFAAQVFLAPPVDVLEFLYFGANSQVMVLQEHQWWRVVTANLLHGNGVHFAVNAFALYFLGTYSERLLGEGRTIVLTLGTALAGATASLLGTEALFAVGISTALFGLLGAYFALHLRFGKELPPPYRQSWLWWGVILGLNAVLSVAVPIIDAWGHFGGFVAGLALAWWMTAGQEKFAPKRPSGAPTNISAAILVALFAVSSFIAIGYATGDHPEDEVTLAQSLLERADQEEPALLTQVSREWSRHSPRPAEINPILVALAEAAYERSDDLFIQWRASSTMISLAEDMGDPFDLGVMERGVARFERMTWQHDDREARLVLVRLIVQTVHHTGPLHLVESPFQRAVVDDQRIALKPGGRLEQPRRVYLLAIDDTGVRPDAEYVLHRCFPVGRGVGTTPTAVDRQLSPEWTIELAMISRAEACTEEEASIWRTTPVVAPGLD